MASPSNRAGTAARGTLIALAVAAVIGAIVFAAVMLISGRAEDALRAVAYVALGYFVLNLIVLVVGLLMRQSGSWAVEAALATPVIIGALGFGYVIYLAYPL